jgi:hypothetical protein
MMKQKSVLLFLALILPVCIFLFLKFFGKNEFSVPPLFIDEAPENATDCRATPVVLPYAVPDSVMSRLQFDDDTLVIVHMGVLAKESSNQLQRVSEEFGSYPIGVLQLEPNPRHRYWLTCVFFLEGPLDLVLLDRNGVIRGQYASDDRKEMDRLLTELSIILKLY